MIRASWLPDPAVVHASRSLTPLTAPGVFDAPPHVRAGSGLCRWRGSLWVAQDDTRLLVEVRDEGCFGVAMPPGPDGLRQYDTGRGNKMLKADLESLFATDDAIWALGSGSARHRELVVRYDGQTVQTKELLAWFDRLRTTPAFAGTELNVEGAVLLGDRLVLANRGNGAGAAVDALASSPWSAFLAAWERPDDLAPPVDVIPVDCGTVDGVRLTITDLDVHHGQLWVLCAAEASPNAIDDGPVVGVAVGRVDGNDLRLRRIVGPDGAPWLDKVEGLVVGDDRAWLVTDADDYNVPAKLLTLDLR